METVTALATLAAVALAIVVLNVWNRRIGTPEAESAKAAGRCVDCGRQHNATDDSGKCEDCAVLDQAARF